MKLSTFNKVNAATLTQYIVFKDGKPSDMFTVDYGEENKLLCVKKKPRC